MKQATSTSPSTHHDATSHILLMSSSRPVPLIIFTNRSYEGFGDVFVRVTLPDSRVLPLESSSTMNKHGSPSSATTAPSSNPKKTEEPETDTETDADTGPSAAVETAWLRGLPYARLPGWHPEHTSVPELLAVGKR